MSELIGPAIARDRLRARLQQLRAARGLSLGAAAQDLGLPESTVRDIESGAETAQPMLVRTVLQRWGSDDALVTELTSLARIARSPRAMARHRLTDDYQQFADYESEAARISIFQPSIIPGLLQTQAYARAVTAAILELPPSHPDVAARVHLRAERQQLVEDRLRSETAPEIVAIIEEAVLHRPVGDADVHRDQLADLLVSARQPHVTLVIMPTGVGGHVGLGGVFELLEFADERDSSLVFIESAFHDHLHRGTETVAYYRAAVESLRRSGRTGDSARETIQEVLDSLSSRPGTDLGNPG
jgi:hypothetical protein